MQKVIWALVIGACLAGCQHVAKVEYYEPTEANSTYCVPATENSAGRGPIKSIEGKSGSPDFSENTTFALDFNCLSF